MPPRVLSNIVDDLPFTGRNGRTSDSVAPRQALSYERLRDRSQYNTKDQFSGIFVQQKQRSRLRIQDLDSLFQDQLQHRLQF